MPTKSKPKKPTRNVELAVAIARHGKPMYAVAAAAGTYPRLLSDALAGRRTPPLVVQERLAGVLGVSCAELFGNTDG